MGSPRGGSEAPKANGVPIGLGFCVLGFQTSLPLIEKGYAGQGISRYSGIHTYG